jgi:hypothetical protein
MHERHEQPATLERSIATSEGDLMTQRRPHSWVAAAFDVVGCRPSKQVGSEHPGMARRGRARRQLGTEVITCRRNL